MAPTSHRSACPTPAPSPSARRPAPPPPAATPSGRPCQRARVSWTPPRVERFTARTKLPPSIAERAVALGRGRVAVGGWTVATGARRSHQYDVAALEHVLA